MAPSRKKTPSSRNLKCNGRLLIAGGSEDPNLKALIEAAERFGVEVVPLLVGKGDNPSFSWQVDADDLWVGKRRVAVDGAFIRRDVFHQPDRHAAYRSTAWYTALQGWLGARPAIRLLNRGYLWNYTNKLYTLRLAQSVGLSIPRTVVSNAIRALSPTGIVRAAVAKPVTGGGYCASLEEVLQRTELKDGIAATPAIVQEKLQGPDVRVFGINGRCHGFIIQSDAVDYRATRNRTIDPLAKLPSDVTAGMKKLMKKMSLNWGAADFKVDPKTDHLVFLEMNSDPMFAVFDRASGGEITRGILRFLIREDRPDAR